MGRHKKEVAVSGGLPPKRTRKEIEIAIAKLRVDIAESEAFIACTRADIEKLMLEYTMAELEANAK